MIGDDVVRDAGELDLRHSMWMIYTIARHDSESGPTMHVLRDYEKP